MDIKVLGKYGRFPLADSGTSSFLVECDGKNIILDMGCSSLSKIVDSLELQDIDLVILSHLHGDHIADFKAFTYMCMIYRMRGKLDHDIKVLMPKNPLRISEDLSKLSGVKIEYIHDRMNYKINKDIDINFYEMTHAVETYGVRIEHNNSIMSYTADTVMCDNLIDLVEGASIVLGDSCVLDKNLKKKSPHLSVKQLADVCAKTNVEELLLIHLPDRDLDAIEDEAKEIFKNSKLGKEGKVYRV